jgi:hypothetical protein
MKHMTFAEKSLLLDDETADALVEYAALLVQHNTGDTVDVHAFGADGDEVDAKLLLSSGAPIMAETSQTSLPDPDNSAALEYIRLASARLAHPVGLPMEGPQDIHEFDAF